MTKGWKVFWLFELVLLVVMGYQLFTDPMTLTILIIGGLLLWAGVASRYVHFGWRLGQKALIVLGSLLVLVTILLNPTIWLMVLLIAMAALLNASDFFKGFWSVKRFVSVKTKPKEERGGTVRRQQWFGDQTIGTDTFSFDDINLSLVSGDTIVDLGNTLLPEGDSTIVIRKGFGKTRVLIPIGVGYVVHHSGLVSTFVNDGKSLVLHNETVDCYSENFDTAPRRVHLITSVVVGDLEVMAI